MKKYIALLAGAQGLYFLFTGLWPVIDIYSFMMLTGPKNDFWLVKMVGLLAASAGLTLLYQLMSAGRRREDISIAARILGLSTAISFLVIDLYYVANRIISHIYLADAAVEVLFICGWIMHASGRARNR